MASKNAGKGKQEAAQENTAPDRPHRQRDNGSNSKDNNYVSGLLGKVTESATKLASNIANGAINNPTTIDIGILDEAKEQNRQNANSAIGNEWINDSVYSHESKGSSSSTSGAGSRREPVLGSASNGAAMEFRRAARAAAAPSIYREPFVDINSVHSGPDTIVPHTHTLERPSHQVQLAQNLDGNDVAEFLSQPQPTSMSISRPRRARPHSDISMRTHGPHSAGTIETIDPVSYLQGTTYNTDMETDEYLVPRRSVDLDRRAHSASPVERQSWAEHESSILEEEWVLNEAWNRAWMDTAWEAARKTKREKEKKESKLEHIFPSNKNLSHILKPRI